MTKPNRLDNGVGAAQAGIQEIGQATCKLPLKNTINPKTKQLERMYKATLSLVAIMMVCLWIAVDIWPPPYTNSQKQSLVLFVIAGVFCFAMIFRAGLYYMKKKHQITGEEFRAYYFSKPLVKTAVFIFVVSATVRLIKSFL